MKRLRGHHLICLHFYDGEGYDAPFIANLERVLETARVEGVEAGDGPDDVCALCPHRKGERCTFSATADREIREMDGRALALLGLRPGERVEWEVLERLAAAAFPEWHRSFCFACNWRWACEKNGLFRRLVTPPSGA